MQIAWLEIKRSQVQASLEAIHCVCELYTLYFDYLVLFTTQVLSDYSEKQLSMSRSNKDHHLNKLGRPHIPNATYQVPSILVLEKSSYWRDDFGHLGNMTQHLFKPSNTECNQSKYRKKELSSPITDYHNWLTLMLKNTQLNPAHL